MASVTTRTLLIFATLVSGLLAGGNVDRAFVAMPAWQQVGATAWAEFSRHADLGNGLILYPIEAIGGALLTIAAAIMIHFDRFAPRAAAVLIYAAALFAAGGLDTYGEGGTNDAWHSRRKRPCCLTARLRGILVLGQSACHMPGFRISAPTSDPGGAVARR
jgi:hypothetical protein